MHAVGGRVEVIDDGAAEDRLGYGMPYFTINLQMVFGFVPSGANRWNWSPSVRT